MDRSKMLNEMLNDKVQNEYNTFIEKLKGLSPVEIIEHSYEKVFKEDLAMALSEKSLSSDEAKAMLSLKYPLDALYQEWMKTDISYMDMLSDIVDYKVESAVKEMKKQNRER
ncbi:DUF3848 domain-containing protein [[Eubacterium] hominis]|uniref:DUF3848 domain-containing protein n=1 Tax=[Eubacterium] hominis TaxID=2764325 RepID=UPI003A4D8013